MSEAVVSDMGDEGEDRARGAVTSLLGDRGRVTREMNTLQMPGEKGFSVDTELSLS